MKHQLFFILCFLSAITTYCPKKAYAQSGNPQIPNPKASQYTTYTIKGFVCDENNDPIPGAVITENGTHNGTVTDEDGLFSIKITHTINESTLTASFLGYQNKTVSIKNKKFISFNMIPNTKMLNDVVVVGFGKQKKESLVGAVTAVKPESMITTSANLSTSFAGRIPGIIATQQSGEPGYSGASFYIRGVSTFGSSTAPLILLDGVEITTSMLDNIAPESIQSFSVLKDATATSLYGSRGANGVILITTKDGHLSDRMTVNIRFNNTISAPTKIQRQADGPTYMEMYNEAEQNYATMNGIDYTPFYNQEQIDKTRAHANPYIFPNNDWYKMMFKNHTMNQDLNFTVRGGTNKIGYFLNAGIYNENGMTRMPKESILNNSMHSYKYLFQSNVTANITPTTKISMKMNTQIQHFRAPYSAGGDGDGRGSMFEDDFFYYAMRGNPVRFPAVLPREEGDTFTRYGNNNSWDVGSIEVNPYAKLSSGYTQRDYTYMTTVFTIDQDLKFITPGLSIKGLASFYNTSHSYLNYYIQPYYYKIEDGYTVDNDGNYHFKEDAVGTPGSTAVSSSSGQHPNTRVWSVQGTIDYNRSFGKSNTGATLVYHMKETCNGTGDYYSLLPYREQGLAGRLTYNYDERYLMEATFGYNGSENFAPNHRFGFFPALAIGWTVSRENFFKSLKKVISNLKLRASYGLVGNDALGSRFPYITTVNLNANRYWNYGTNYSTAYGPIINTFGNKNATWEKSKKLNIGADISLWNCLDMTIDIFHENRTGIFMQRQSIASTLGFGGSLPYANIGAVKNHGIDIGLNLNKVINRDWIIGANGSFTYAHDEVTQEDEPTNVNKYYSAIGHPVNSIRGYISEGLFTSEDEVKNSPVQTFSNYTIGDIKYKDLNHDGKIDGNDVTTIGNPTVPEIIYGFGANVKYKKWDASIFFQGDAKVSLQMNNIWPFADNQHMGYNIAQYIVKDHWSMTNNIPNAEYPRLSPVYLQNDVQCSTYYVRNAAYLRLKTTEIGYNFSKWLRLYIAGTNLLTLSSFKTWDPEIGSGNGLSYPLQRTFQIGIQFHY